ncbi:MAG: hypothetical protein ACFFCS_03070 [Candidatus Hodarchaeota archaeon]
MSLNDSQRKKKKKVSKQAWMFLVVGLPLFILLLMMVIGYMVPNGIIMLTTAIGLFLVTMRKKNIGIRFTRTSFIAVVTCFFTVGALVENPLLWPEQIVRHAFKSTLIQPNNEKIVELHNAFNWWLDNWDQSFDVSSIHYYGDNITDTSKPLEEDYRKNFNLHVDHLELSLVNYTNDTIYSDIDRVAIADRFIRWFVIKWTDDQVTHHVSDHTPVPNEALADWNFNATWQADPDNSTWHAHDDCDGIAVVTVSFVRRLAQEGYISANAYIGQGKNHWFTSVYFNETTPYVFFNHFTETCVYCIYMDNNLPLFGQNILITMQTVLMTDEEERDEFLYYLDFVMGENIWIMIIAAVLVAMLAVILFGYPRNYDPIKEREYVKEKMAPHKNKPKILKPFIWLFAVKIRNPFKKRHMFFWLNVAIISLMLIAGIYILYNNILSTWLYTNTTMFMYGAIFFILLVLDRDPVTGIIKRVYKKVKGKEFSLYNR